MKPFLPGLAVLALALAACNGDAAPVDAAPTPPAAVQAERVPASAPADAGNSTTAAGTTGTWSYDSAKDSDGSQTRASIAGIANGGAATLVFSDHDVWGRSVVLQPSQGDIECPVGCKVQVSVDGGAAQAVQASRPESTPPKLSLREPEALWKSIAAAHTLTIEYPLASGTAKAEFAVAGADAGKLPGWN